ncbi:MAG: hypothetical protein UMU75_07415 [Halomonas sp.]|nr:hypothetical protein [Halomonas sp.]
MAKNFIFNLDRHQESWFFAPLRKKEDVIRMLLEAVKLMTIYVPPSKCFEGQGSMVLKISKMSRLLFESENKIFSINFPFKVLEAEEGLNFVSPSGVVLDSMLTSEVLAFLAEDEILYSDDIFDFASPIVDGELDREKLWALLRDLFFYEDGYLRFDHDAEHMNGHLHPLNHFDFFYSSKATFKIGLYEKFDVEKFFDVMDITTPCHYLGPAN